MKKLSLFFSALFSVSAIFGAEHIVKSPNGKLEAVVSDTNGVLTFGVNADGKSLIPSFEIGLKTSRGEVGKDAKLEVVDFNRIENKIENKFGIRSQAIDNCNEYRFKLASRQWLYVRAYDDAVAYRFQTRLGDTDITIENEKFSLPISDSDQMITHPLKEYTSFESDYFWGDVSAMKKMYTVMLPFVFKRNGYTIGLLESDVRDYPSLRLSYPKDAKCPQGFFSKYPKSFYENRKFEWQAKEVEPFIAKTNGMRYFPWRAFVVAKDEAQLACNDLSFRLGSPSEIKDTSWIQGGISVWDWWNNWTLTDVDFESGINMQTYKYYVDYASENKIDWIVIDTGWLNGGEIGRVSHEGCDEMFMEEKLHLDVPAIIKYAHKKGVKIMPWILARTLHKYDEEAFKIFKRWGADGLKIDFIDRDDQLANRMLERFAYLASKYKMVVDFHGCIPPNGIQRTYPNILNFEGVRGMECTKWMPVPPEHNLTIPFVRMLAGQMDYTPGAMRNTAKEHYKTCYTEPFAMGTRAQLTAMFVIYFAPFQMMCDSPSMYLKCPQTLKFVSTMPTTWDDSKVIAGEIGKYLIMARRKGDDWYIAGMCDWNGKKVKIDLSKIVPEGEYKAEIFKDGTNANRIATDFKYEERDVKSTDVLDIEMKKGGGFVVKLKK